ncbi:hypothetical protein A6R68_09507 [Neotoma lepida]|uniref:Uncharacterized protein n=1 Tax=Neotoma lepida TaxID=56216 RepID=A0A1A6FZK9_NEOLE|nr:hypothetical protein A6R68_09507 [Neotoma lepida]
MAKREERGPQTSALKLHSGHGLQFSQPPLPGTPFPFPQRDDDTPPEWGKHLTSTEDPRDFPSQGVIRLTRHKFRCQKPYEGKTFKVPDSRTADSLQSLRALIESTSSQKTLDPTKEPKENKEGKVPLPQEVPECTSNPLGKEPRPSALQPATRKRVAFWGPIHGKVKRSLTMSTVLEELMVFDQSGTRVTATSSGLSAVDASENFEDDDTVPGTFSAGSSTDHRGLICSKQLQGVWDTYRAELFCAAVGIQDTSPSKARLTPCSSSSRSCSKQIQGVQDTYRAELFCTAGGVMDTLPSSARLTLFSPSCQSPLSCNKIPTLSVVMKRGAITMSAKELDCLRELMLPTG